MTEFVDTQAQTLMATAGDMKTTKVVELPTIAKEGQVSLKKITEPATHPPDLLQATHRAQRSFIATLVNMKVGDTIGPQKTTAILMLKPVSLKLPLF